MWSVVFPNGRGAIGHETLCDALDSIEKLAAREGWIEVLESVVVARRSPCHDTYFFFTPLGCIQVDTDDARY